MRCGSKLVIQPSTILSFVAGMIFVIFINLPGAEANDIWILAKENACFDSTSFGTNWTFNAPYTGTVTAVQLHHVSGSVTCHGGASNNWGCTAYDGAAFMVQMLRHDDDGSESTVLPTNSTQNVTEINDDVPCSSGHGCSVVYFSMNGFDLYSEVLTWRDPEADLVVSVTNTFSLQYHEGCCSYTDADNEGTSCADIYFQYAGLCMSYHISVCEYIRPLSLI